MIKIKKYISKTQYTRGLQCVKSLWLYNYRKDLQAEVSPSTQATFDQGHEVGDLARTYYKGGVLLKQGREDIAGAIKETAELLAKGTTLLYEATFQADNVLVRCDILRKVKGEWHLIEVKSSTELKDQHLGDIAVQKYVIEACGVKIARAFLMVIDKEFVRSGPVDPKKFFKQIDVTEDIKDAEAEVPATLKEFFAALAKPGCEPDIAIGGHCSNPYDCDFQGYCWKGIPSYSAYNFGRLKPEVREDLISRGILDVKDFPSSLELSAAQEDFVRCAKTGRPIIRKEEVKEFVDSLKYPLYHLDFETLNPAVPLYDGQKPYRHFPFQASLHIEDKAGGLKHYEYLADGINDPRQDIIDFLLNHIDSKGTPLAYCSGFEASQIRGLAAAFPKHAASLEALADRFVDLAGPFRSRHVLFPQFQGGYSIKVVLPTLVPGMTYEGMPVANGGDAQIAFASLLSGKLDKAAAAQVRADLLAYCGQDTLAMVKILAWLKNN
jgi:hypothetical protein